MVIHLVSCLSAPLAHLEGLYPIENFKAGSRGISQGRHQWWNFPARLRGQTRQGFAGKPWASEMANKNMKWTNRMNPDELQGSSFLNSDTQCLSTCGNRSGWFNPLLSNINSVTHAMGSCCNFCLLSSERINGVGPLILFPISLPKVEMEKKITWMDTLLETKISIHLDTYPIPARKKVDDFPFTSCFEGGIIDSVPWKFV